MTRTTSSPTSIRAARTKWSRRSGRRRGLAGLAPAPVGGARRGLLPRRRAPRRPLARHAQRGHDARPVEDRAPGRDRRRLRAHRLLALQPLLHEPGLRGAALLGAGVLEPDGVPPARGLRLRRHAVQLHRDRREPADRPGAHGQHVGLEAGRHGDALRLLHDEAPPGGRASRRRGQPRLRLRQGDRRRRAREP